MTISTARKKAWREEVKVMTSVRSVNLIMLSVWEASSGVKGIFVWNLQLAMKSKSIITRVQVICPFSVSKVVIIDVIELRDLLGQLHKSAMLKVLHLEAKKAKLSKKLIRSKFNMEYFKSVTLEAYDSITNCECEL